MMRRIRTRHGLLLILRRQTAVAPAPPTPRERGKLSDDRFYGGSRIYSILRFCISRRHNQIRTTLHRAFCIGHCGICGSLCRKINLLGKLTDFGRL